MGDVSGVLWGALIALLASVTGGVLTAVVGPALSRRAEERVRAEVEAAQAAAERQRVLRQAIHDVSEGLRAWVEAWGSQRLDDRRRARESVRTASLQLRLWTTREERVVQTVTDVLTARDPYDAAARFGAWDTAAVDWFRGALPTERFAELYQATVDGQAEWIATERKHPHRGGL